MEAACRHVILRTASLDVRLFFGSTDRNKAPKILNAPLIDPQNPNEVRDFRMKLEFGDLHTFAYGAAATCACADLPEPPYRVLLDRNATLLS